MWFFPRNNAFAVLAIITGIIGMYTLGLDEVAYVIGTIVTVYLLLGVIFDLYEGSKK